MDKAEYDVLNYDFNQLLRLCILTVTNFELDDDVRTMFGAIISTIEHSRNLMRARYEKQEQRKLAREEAVA